jgi:hypothetical protein
MNVPAWWATLSAATTDGCAQLAVQWEHWRCMVHTSLPAGQCCTCWHRWLLPRHKQAARADIQRSTLSLPDNDMHGGVLQAIQTATYSFQRTFTSSQAHQAWGSSTALVFHYLTAILHVPAQQSHTHQHLPPGSRASKACTKEKQYVHTERGRAW